MSKRIINRTTYHHKGNRQTRPLYSLANAPMTTNERTYFDYITGEDTYSERLFKYRGSWYDYYEFERAGDDIKALGYDGIQTESYFSAVAVSYFDRDGYELDGEIIAGYIHW